MRLDARKQICSLSADYLLLWKHSAHLRDRIPYPCSSMNRMHSYLEVKLCRIRQGIQQTSIPLSLAPYARAKLYSIKPFPNSGESSLRGPDHIATITFTPPVVCGFLSGRCSWKHKMRLATSVQFFAGLAVRSIAVPQGNVPGDYRGFCVTEERGERLKLRTSNSPFRCNTLVDGKQYGSCSNQYCGICVVSE